MSKWYYSLKCGFFFFPLMRNLYCNSFNIHWQSIKEIHPSNIFAIIYFVAGVFTHPEESI